LISFNHALFDSVSENSVHIGFDISGKYLLSAGDKHVHVFHNVTGKTWLMISYVRSSSSSKGLTK